VNVFPSTAHNDVLLIHLRHKFCFRKLWRIVCGQLLLWNCV